jgi:hypothetical protein
MVLMSLNRPTAAASACPLLSLRCTKLLYSWQRAKITATRHKEMQTMRVLYETEFMSHNCSTKCQARASKQDDMFMSYPSFVFVSGCPIQ